MIPVSIGMERNCEHYGESFLHGQKRKRPEIRGGNGIQRRSRALPPGGRWQPEGLTEEERRNLTESIMSDATQESKHICPHSSSVRIGSEEPILTASPREKRQALPRQGNISTVRKGNRKVPHFVY